MQTQSDPTAVMGRRIGAYIIDWLLSFVVIVAVLALTKNHVYTGAPSNACQILRDAPGGFSGRCLEFGSRVYTWKSGGFLAAYLAGGLVSIANLVVLQGATGASIGKMIVGLRVVDAQGAPCGIGRALLRWILLVVDGACFLIGLIVALATHPHRRIGDMAAGTYVVALASAGRPVVGSPPAPSFAYAQPGTPGWTPPGASPPPPPGWGTTPPPAWGAPTDAPPPWGAPGAPPPAPTAAPTEAPTDAPPATPQDRSGWGAPAPTWGAPAAPQPPPPATPPPPALPDPGARAWAPPDPAQDRSGWGATPSPSSPPPAPASEPPEGNVPPAPSPAPAEPEAPAPTPPVPTPPTPAEGESWWNKAFDDDDPDK